MIIGLSGLAGSGKTTVAKLLVHKYDFIRRPFAYPLKAMIAALGFDREVLDGPAAGKELPLDLFGGRSLREAMQTLGTEWGRAQFGDEFWIRMWANGLDKLLSPVVADDVRFPNEAEAVRSRGGIIVRLTRTGSGSKTGAGHSSENIDGIVPDLIVNNDGTMEQLADDVGGIVRYVVRKNMRAAE